LNQADQNLTVELAMNALRVQEKSENAKYHKNLAQSIKQELDSQKGSVQHFDFSSCGYICFQRNLECYCGKVIWIFCDA
jgi:hypothetical protein